jgi:hypothetical protein
MIIGLSGYGQSGKDTVAGMLIGLHGYDNRAFAKPMRTALYALNPFIGGDTHLKDIIDMHGWEYAKRYTDARRLLQVFGTEVGRDMFGENFWIDQAMKGVSSSQKVVFTDVRFPNEASAIKDLKGEVWRVKRPGYAPINDHPSESALDYWEFDRIIMNTAGLDGLASQIAANLGELDVV